MGNAIYRVRLWWYKTGESGGQGQELSDMHGREVPPDTEPASRGEMADRCLSAGGKPIGEPVGTCNDPTYAPCLCCSVSLLARLPRLRCPFTGFLLMSYHTFCFSLCLLFFCLSSIAPDPTGLTSSLSPPLSSFQPRSGRLLY